MFFRKLFITLLFVAMFSCAAFSPASSRLWKAAPNAIAGDYAGISHDRGNGEFVMIRWFAPPTLAPTSQGEALKAALEKYVVIMVVHSKFTPSSGEISFITSVPTLIEQIQLVRRFLREVLKGSVLKQA
jgi:hypothetical protein